MEKLGQKKLVIKLHEKLSEIPDRLSPFQLDLTNEGKKLIYFYHEHQEDNGIEKVLPVLHELNIKYKDLHTEQSSLEEIFVNLVSAQ
jgi:ABC-2 type transport system ATP-binding protein